MTDKDLPRLRFIQRWRRIVWLTCLFLALYALGVFIIGHATANPRAMMLIWSLGIFILALLVAVNFLTLKARK